MLWELILRLTCRMSLFPDIDVIPTCLALICRDPGASLPRIAQDFSTFLPAVFRLKHLLLYIPHLFSARQTAARWQIPASSYGFCLGKFQVNMIPQPLAGNSCYFAQREFPLALICRRGHHPWFALLQWGNRHELKCLSRTCDSSYFTSSRPDFSTAYLSHIHFAFNGALLYPPQWKHDRSLSPKAASKNRRNTSYFSGMTCGNLQACWILAFLPSKFAVFSAWKSTEAFRSAFPWIMKEYHSLEQNNY